MTTVLIVLGCLVGLFVLISIIGRFLSGDFAAHTSVELPHPPQDVWNAIADFRRHPMGGGMTRGVEIEETESDAPGPMWVEDIGSSNTRIKTERSEEPSTLIRTLEDLVVPMTARWKYSLQATEVGTQLTIESATKVNLGTWHAPIFRVLIKLTNGVQRGVDHYVARLGKTLQADAATT